MQPKDIAEIITNLESELQGKSRGEIENLMNEIAEHTNGSIIDGIKIGYLFAIANLDLEEN